MDNEIALISQLQECEITPTQLQSKDFSTKYECLTNMLKYLTDIKKAVDEEIKKVIEKEFKKSGEASVSSEKYTFTYVSSSTKANFDTSSFKNEHPELYTQYCKISNTKSSIRVTEKKKKEERPIEIDADEQ